MNINRREFLETTGVASTAFLAGCSGSNSSAAEEPFFEVLELFQSKSQLVSVDNVDQESFSATVQNTEHSGLVAIALFWQMEESATEPESVGSLGTNAFPKERMNEVYFDAGERRTIEFTAQPPDDAIGYLFLAQASTYGANIRNTGGDGRAVVTFSFTSPSGIGASTEDTSYIESESTREIIFEQITEPNSEWEIEVQPANAE